jgi:hypothetical protein
MYDNGVMLVDWTAIAKVGGFGMGLFFTTVKLFDLFEDGLNDDARKVLADRLKVLKLSPTPDEADSLALKLFRVMCGPPNSKKRLIVSLVLCGANGILSGLSIGHKYVSIRKVAVEFLYFAFTLVLMQVVILANEYTIMKGRRLRAFWISVLTVAASVVVGFVCLVLWSCMSFARALSSPRLPLAVLGLSVVPVIAVSVWMWIPIVAVFVLKAARRLDIGVAWFTKYFDKKPIRNIGIVTGAFFAILFWAAAVILHSI